MSEYKIPDYPVPDPAWEYAGIWSEIWEMKAQIEITIKYMSEIEDPNNESDNILRDYFSDLQTKLNSARALLNSKAHQRTD